jgi:Acetyl-CoA carboxylase beta subunit
MNWITKFIKRKIKSLFKKQGSDKEEALWKNCECKEVNL